MASPMTDPGLSDRPYNDPTPMPDEVPKVQELGATSAPLKSAAFFIGAFCKEYNGIVAFSCSLLMYVLNDKCTLAWYPCVLTNTMVSG